MPRESQGSRTAIILSMHLISRLFVFILSTFAISLLRLYKDRLESNTESQILSSCHKKMYTSVVEIGVARIKTTVTQKERDINRLVKTFLSNSNNTKKIIGLDTELSQKARKQNKTALLQLCDGDNCLIVQLPDDEDEKEDDNCLIVQLPDDEDEKEDDNCLIVQLPDDEDEKEDEDDDSSLPLSLFNFLNLPDFTFVGIGINKTLTKLESEFGLTCKNALEIGPSTWNLFSKTANHKIEKLTSAVFEDWDKFSLNKNQINLAASHAYFAFGSGDSLLDGFGF